MRKLKKMSRCLALLLTVALLACIAPAALALDLSETGSITVILTDPDTGKTVTGGELTLYQVATVKTVSGNLVYTLTEEFTESGVSLTDLSDTSLAGTLADYAEEQGLTGTTQTIRGEVTFSNLETGLYLIVQTTASSGYYAVDSFLVAVPMYDSTEGWMFNIDASPKVEVLPVTPTPDRPTPTPSDKPEEPDEEEPEESEEPEEPDDEDEETVAPIVTPDDSDTPDDPSVPEEETPETEPAPSASTTPTVTPDEGTSLPQTGQLNWPVPVLAGCGLLLFIIGWTLTYRRKKDRADEA